MASLLQWATTYTGPVGKDDMHDIFAYCLRRTISSLQNGKNRIPQIVEDTKKLNWDEMTFRKYLFNTLVNDEGSPKTLEINKRNIEFRTGTEASHVLIPGTLDIQEDIFDFYGLKDIFLDVIIFRVGRYSYYAAQVTPFFKNATENPRVVLANTVD